jgi:hypothetical protein
MAVIYCPGDKLAAASIDRIWAWAGLLHKVMVTGAGGKSPITNCLSVAGRH